MSSLRFVFVFALAPMLIASVSSVPVVYKAACTGASVVPTPITSKATGLASVTVFNKTYATGYFYAANINQVTMARLNVGPVGYNGPPQAWGFNGTYGPISGSFKATFTFDPSVNKGYGMIYDLLAAGQIYFIIHTTAYPLGEIRGQFAALG